MRYSQLPASARFVINTIIILAFLVGLFFAGMAVYSAVMELSFAEVWQQFLLACRGTK